MEKFDILKLKTLQISNNKKYAFFHINENKHIMIWALKIILEKIWICDAKILNDIRLQDILISFDREISSYQYEILENVDWFFEYLSQITKNNEWKTLFLESIVEKYFFSNSIN